MINFGSKLFVLCSDTLFCLLRFLLFGEETARDISLTDADFFNLS